MRLELPQLMCRCLLATRMLLASMPHGTVVNDVSLSSRPVQYRSSMADRIWSYGAGLSLGLPAAALAVPCSHMIVQGQSRPSMQKQCSPQRLVLCTVTCRCKCMVTPAVSEGRAVGACSTGQALQTCNILRHWSSEPAAACRYNAL